MAHQIMRLPGSPQALALGVAIGLFLAFTPTLGVQMLLAAVLAAGLRASKAAALAAVWISNPLTAAPIYAATYGVGVWVRPDSGPILALSVGGVLLGLLAALVGYGVVYRVMCRREGAALLRMTKSECPRQGVGFGG